MPDLGPEPSRRAIIGYFVKRAPASWLRGHREHLAGIVATRRRSLLGAVTKKTMAPVLPAAVTS